MSRRALITGLTGQDGSYLAELLLEKGYEVHGLVRRTSTPSTSRVAHLLDRIAVHPGDLCDGDSLNHALDRARPHEIYNLAAQSDVAASFGQPVLTQDVNGTGVVRLLEAMRRSCPAARLYQASSSEMFGATSISPQDERTPFHPRSPYALSKVYAHHAVVHYREAYGLFAVSGIAFNHESPRRGERFVTRKVAMGVAAIARGEADALALGNLAARRDWGWAPEYVDAMWRMLQADEPADLVLATGMSHSVEQLVRVAFEVVGLDWRDHVATDPEMFRPTEVDHLTGDPRAAQAAIGWAARVGFEELVGRMVRAELERAPVA